MPSPRADLINELSRLVRLAGTDENAAMAAFRHLSMRYRRAEIAAALTAVTAAYLGSEVNVR